MTTLRPPVWISSLVSHIGEAFLVPIYMLVMDQRGEAAHVRWTARVHRTSHDSCLW